MRNLFFLKIRRRQIPAGRCQINKRRVRNTVWTFNFIGSGGEPAPNTERIKFKLRKKGNDSTAVKLTIFLVTYCYAIAGCTEKQPKETKANRGRGTPSRFKLFRISRQLSRSPVNCPALFYYTEGLLLAAPPHSRENSY